MKLGAAIKKARQVRGLTQAELANRLGVSANYISLLETDRRDPSWSFVCNLAAKLNVPLAMLVLLASEEPKSDARTKVERALTQLLLSLEIEANEGE